MSESASAPKVKNGLRVGLNKGFKVSVRTVAKGAAGRRGVKSKRVAVIREVVRDVCGMAPYEKRIMDVIKVSYKGGLHFLAPALRVGCGAIGS